MVLDLDKAILNDRDYIHIGGKKKKYYFRELSIMDDLQVQAKIKDIMNMPISTPEEEKEGILKIREVLGEMIELPPSLLKKMGIPHFKAIVKYIERKPFYDKGLDDETIDRLESYAFEQNVIKKIDEISENL